MHKTLVENWLCQDAKEGLGDDPVSDNELFDDDDLVEEEDDDFFEEDEDDDLFDEEDDDLH